MSPSHNVYGRELTAVEIAAGVHREMVGGLWDVIGPLQLAFLRSEGLEPRHRLVDIGCGALRGGLHFASFLDDGRYFGVDRNESLVAAGRHELAAAGISLDPSHLRVDEHFDLAAFGVAFDYALAVSLFTHLTPVDIAACLDAVAGVLVPSGRFYATFFQAPHSVHREPIRHTPGDITTYRDADPFHYSWDELRALAEPRRLSARLIGEWQHPRDQQMACFTSIAR